MKKAVLIFFLVIGMQEAFQNRVEGACSAIVLQDISSTEDEKVRKLITFVRNLNGAVFIRNGKEFTPGKAADHLQSKYNKHKKKINTANDFVEKLATQSKTKEPYQIRYDSGTTVKLRDLLKKELAKLES